MTGDHIVTSAMTWAELREPPPARAEHSVVNGDVPKCGACGRRLQHADAWRCPYVTCRTWLRGTEA